MMKVAAFGCIVLLVASVMVFSLLTVPELASAYTQTEEDLEFVVWMIDTVDSASIYDHLLTPAIKKSDYDDLELYSVLLDDFCQEKLSEIDQFAVSSEMQPAKTEFELVLQDWNKATYYLRRGEIVTAEIYFESATRHMNNCDDMLLELNLEMEESTPEVTPSPTPEETPTPQAEEDSDGDGVPDDYDYAPKDPNVQSQADVKTQGFGAIFAIVSLLAVAFGLRRRK